MRVALVMPVATQLGGAEMMLLHLLRGNIERPCVDYRLAFLEDGPMVGETRELGYACEVIPAGRLREPRHFFVTVAALGRWLAATRPDGVLSWMGKAHLYAGPAARRAGIAAVWCQHLVPDRHWMNRACTLVPARAIFCSSQSVARAQQRLKPHRETRVVYPAVDLDRFSSNKLPSSLEARSRLGLPANGPLIGVVARLQRQKGVHVFVEAASLLRKTHPDCSFVVVGGRFPLEPAYLDTLQQMAQRCGLKDAIHFAGQQKDVALWMQAMDAVVLPSIVSEGFGMILVEAMALGKAVVATRTGGPEEIIEDGVDGYLTTPGDAEELASGMRRAVERSGEATMAAAAIRKAKNYGVDRLACETANALNSAFAGPYRKTSI